MDSVEILDGTPVNGFFWVFYGGLTDLEFTLTVTDLATARVRSYHKDPGSACGGFDTAAFPRWLRKYFQLRGFPSAIHSTAVPSRLVRVSSVFTSVDELAQAHQDRLGELRGLRDVGVHARISLSHPQTSFAERIYFVTL